MPAAHPLDTLLANRLATALEGGGRCKVVFVSGPQGIGKTTTLARALSRLDVRAVLLGLDDFYLSRADRLALAADIHPLFETRGPPGTHYTGRIGQTLEALANATDASRVRLPRFDKARDDLAPVTDWPVHAGTAELIVFEGWMLGALPDPAAPGAAPINAVEMQDTDGTWRAYQEDRLANEYAALWAMAGGFIHLTTDRFENVEAWRLQQERDNLALPQGAALPEARAGWVRTFIRHFERITRRMIGGGKRPGHEIRLDAARRILP